MIFTNDAYTQGETTIMNWEIKRLGTVNKVRWQFLSTFKQKSLFKACIYSLSAFKWHKSNIKNLLVKSSEIVFIFLPAFYLIIWLMTSPKNSEKISILKIWQLVFFWVVKIYFGKFLLKWCIFRHGKIRFSQIMIFWSFFRTMPYTKDNFCFNESIFQWQIKLISHRSEFWQLRRKPAVIFSKWIFFQNSLEMSWAI